MIFPNPRVENHIKTIFNTFIFSEYLPKNAFFTNFKDVFYLHNCNELTIPKDQYIIFYRIIIGCALPYQMN